MKQKVKKHRHMNSRSFHRIFGLFACLIFPFPTHHVPCSLYFCFLMVIKSSYHDHINDFILKCLVCASTKGERSWDQSHCVPQWCSRNWKVHILSHVSLFLLNVMSNAEFKSRLTEFSNFHFCRPQSDFESFLNIGLWFKKYCKWA